MSEQEKLPIPDKNPFPDLFPDQYHLFKNTRAQLTRVVNLNNSPSLFLVVFVVFCLIALSIIINAAAYFQSQYEPQLTKFIIELKVSFTALILSTLTVFIYNAINKRRHKQNLETIYNFRDSLSEKDIEQIVVCLRDLNKTYSVYTSNPYELAILWLATSDSIILYRCVEYLFSDEDDCLQVSMHDDEYISNHYPTTTFAGILNKHKADQIINDVEMIKKKKREQLEMQLFTLGNNSQ